MQALVIVPTYNEAENIQNLLEVLLALPEDLGVLVVDDNSPDGTAGLVEAMGRETDRVMVLKRSGKLGLGTAYVDGFKWGLANTGADYFIQMDADFSHDPQKIPELLNVARTGSVGIGSRYVPGGGTVNWGLGRRLLSRFGSLYAGIILGLPINDVTGGYKCWPRQVLESIGLDDVMADGYAFQAEMSYRARRSGASLREIPIIFEDRRVGQSKMSMGIALEALWLVWKIRLQ